MQLYLLLMWQSEMRIKAFACSSWEQNLNQGSGNKCNICFSLYHGFYSQHISKVWKTTSYCGCLICSWHWQSGTAIKMPSVLFKQNKLLSNKGEGRIMQLHMNKNVHKLESLVTVCLTAVNNRKWVFPSVSFSSLPLWCTNVHPLFQNPKSIAASFFLVALCHKIQALLIKRGALLIFFSFSDGCQSPDDHIQYSVEMKTKKLSKIFARSHRKGTTIFTQCLNKIKWFWLRG